MILPLYLITLALVIFPIAALNMYEGDYRLTEIFDQDHKAVVFPAEDDFRLSLTKGTADPESVKPEGDSFYQFSLKLGNVIRAEIAVATDGTRDRVKFGRILSTRMMPPPALMAAENTVNTLLPETEFIYKSGDVLQLEGAQGKVIFRAI